MRSRRQDTPPNPRCGSFGEQIEPHAPPCTSPFFRGVAKELCRAAPAFAAPFVRGFDEIARLERSTKACLVQTPTKQQFVHSLEIAQGESWRQQAKRERRLINALAHDGSSTIDDGTVARREGGK